MTEGLVKIDTGAPPGVDPDGERQSMGSSHPANPLPMLGIRASKKGTSNTGGSSPREDGSDIVPHRKVEVCMCVEPRLQATPRAATPVRPAPIRITRHPSPEAQCGSPISPMSIGSARRHGAE
jgi:hypothetical protein